MNDITEKLGEKLRAYLYYILVGVLSLIMLVFMPMLGSATGLQWILPTTTAGWIVYCICKLCSAAFNISLFHCFNKQGKLNIIKHEKYLEARELLKKANSGNYKKARSPHVYHRDIYGKKGISIFLMTLLGTVGLSQAILSFDIKEFIVQAIALMVGIIFGILQMKDTESYWTEEYYEYAVDYTKELEEEQRLEREAQDVLEDMVQIEQEYINKEETEDVFTE